MLVIGIPATLRYLLERVGDIARRCMRVSRLIRVTAINELAMRKL